MAAAEIEILERAILDNPEEVAAYAAYADCLTQQGNPQGELIQVQLALEEEHRPREVRDALKRREAELLKNVSEIVGDWAALAPTDFDPEGRGQLPFASQRPWGIRRGILHEITLPSLTLACARAFVREPKTRLVQRLSLGGWAYEEPGSYEEPENQDDDALDEYSPSSAVFSQWPYFPNLRAFQFGWTSDEVYGDFCSFQCHLQGPRAVELIERMPRLEELHLFADSIDTTRLFGLSTLDHLRVLQVYHCWSYPLEVLAQNAALSNLTHLLLHPKAGGAWTEDAGAYIKRDGVRALLESPHLGKLAHLRLRLSDLGDQGCEDIVRSGILKRLETLDLRHGAISDKGARILAACPDLRRLRHLDLKRNQLTDEGIRVLREIVPSLEASFQHAPAQIEDGSYLFEGDYE